MRKKQFKAESKRLLDLMINSIYTHKEIFLREIISNASDAIDKLRYISLTDKKVGLKSSDFKITISLDEANRTITVSDNGIGMNEEDLENNLGVIASSGSFKFNKELGDKAKESEIIGQFGVGFYSAFMVSDSITVITKKYGEDKAYKWESEGAEGYSIEECQRDTVGTDIIMHVKEDSDGNDEYGKYLREYTITDLIKKYSDYIRFPIVMLVTKEKLKEDSPKDKPEYVEYKEYETLNSMVPIWQRKKDKVKKEEYDTFYQQHFYDMNAPLVVVPVSAEGTVEYKALLFIPEKAPGMYYSEEYKPGLQLYSMGVKIMENCEDLLPEYFNFVKGVVDSPDLSLNISREMLQHDRQLEIIKKHLEKKIKSELEKMLKENREDYIKFYHSFGRQLKVCAINDYGVNKENLQDLLLFYSSKEKKEVTLEEYVGRMKENQKYIYFASGESVDSVDNLPQIELLKDHDMEILYFTDKADEFIPSIFRDYKEKQFRSAIDEDLDLEDQKKPEEGAYKEDLEYIKTTLGDKVDEVKVSNKLKTHPVCMTSGEGLSFEMEKYFKAVQPEMKMKAKRILEINVDHEAFKTISSARLLDEEKAKKYIEVLYNQALLIAGLPIEDPSKYTDLICTLFK